MDYDGMDGLLLMGRGMTLISEFRRRFGAGLMTEQATLSPGSGDQDDIEGQIWDLGFGIWVWDLGVGFHLSTRKEKERERKKESVRVHGRVCRYVG